MMDAKRMSAEKMPGARRSAAPEPADIETSSAGYAARFAGRTGAWMLRVQERIVRSMIPAPAGRLLDVGGGHGQVAIPLARAGYDVTVLGSASVCGVRLAEEVAAGRLKFVVGSVVELPFTSGAFDHLVCLRLLPHSPEWPRLVADLCRVARVSVIVDYPTSQSLNAFSEKLFGLKKRIEGNTRPYTLFRHAEVVDEFQRHGFQCVARQPQFFLPMVLHRTLRCAPLSAGLEWVCSLAGWTRRWGSPVIAHMARCPPPAQPTGKSNT